MRRRGKVVSIDAGKPRAVGYVRVSTGKQALSPEAQQEKIQQLATLQGVDLVEIITDRESAKEGSIHKRPGIARILELSKAQSIERVITAKLDRLTRSVVDLGELLTALDRAHVGLCSATETWMDTSSAAGRLVINIIVSVAQWEREAIGERTAAVLQFKRSHGQVYNHTPFGFQRNGDRLTLDAGEQAIIREICEMRDAGVTLRAIADRLTRRATPTKTGGHWHASTVASILRQAA